MSKRKISGKSATSTKHLVLEEVVSNKQPILAAFCHDGCRGKVVTFRGVAALHNSLVLYKEVL